MNFYRPPTTRGILDALGALYRAVRIWRFYPKGHPLRRSSLTQAHSALLQQLDGNTLSLSCSRTGFSYPDGESLKDASRLTASLAYELFVRRVQKITFFPDLFQEDLLELLRLFCLPPEEIRQSGGMDAMMTARGVRTVWVNEFDLAALRGKRQQVEAAGIIPPGIDEAESAGDSAPVMEQLPHPEAHAPEPQLQELLERLASCGDGDTYLILIRQAVACTDAIMARDEQHMILQLIELLVDHESDEARSRAIREHARFALEQVITVGGVLQFVLERTERDNGVPKKVLRAVLQAGGTAAITAAIEMMGRTGSFKSRKTLSTMLGGLGEGAVPALTGLMNDSRWFITRNICAILGSIASREGLAALSKCLHHPDLRVRKEAVRSLAQIGGPDAESAVIGILRGGDTALYPQAIASLGGIKSRRAVPELMQIVFSRDLFLKSLPLKIDALAAIASIGDRQVTPQLVALFDERNLLAAARGKRLKAAAANCLGKLGDPRALPYLERVAAGEGTVASACSDAIVQIEKAGRRADGNS